MSQVLEIELSDELLLGLQKNPKQLAAEIRAATAIKWYEMGFLTQAKAAESVFFRLHVAIKQHHRHRYSWR